MSVEWCKAVGHAGRGTILGEYYTGHFSPAFFQKIRHKMGMVLYIDLSMFLEAEAGGLLSSSLAWTIQQNPVSKERIRGKKTQVLHG